VIVSLQFRGAGRAPSNVAGPALHFTGDCHGASVRVGNRNSRNVPLGGDCRGRGQFTRALPPGSERPVVATLGIVRTYAASKV
jgi:hypothetical protein